VPQQTGTAATPLGVVALACFHENLRTRLKIFSFPVVSISIFQFSLLVQDKLALRLQYVQYIITATFCRTAELIIAPCTCYTNKVWGLAVGSTNHQ
jgi:hypothetical protein